MKVTKERKILGGLLAAGLLALIVDRASGGGATADMQTEATTVTPVMAPAAAKSPAAVPATPAVATPASKPSLASRIDQLAKSDLAGGPALASYRDPFLVGRLWSGSGADDADAGVGKPARFERDHRLTAVIVAGRRSSAMVNGSLVRVGQSVGGHTLVAVTHDMAVLDRGDSRVVLKLERTSPANPTAGAAH
ncbi:MAG TPA: hypothetical protein VEA69_19455 [Tepidisphaeraceae bacterium]|nr:hypothetical protein [Tepidisphaeraceae bacterium]